MPMIDCIRWPTIRTALVLSAVLLGEALANAQEPQPEYKFKAAYIYHFAQFVEWPPKAFPTATSPLVISVLGQNPFGNELERALNQKTINGHPLMVRTVRDPAEALTNCHVLFISSSEKKRLPEIFSILRGASVLTIGETDTFIESGGMIRFLFEEKKIRFEINDEAARAAGLAIRAKLLSLAVKP